MYIVLFQPEDNKGFTLHSVIHGHTYTLMVASYYNVAPAALGANWQKRGSRSQVPPLAHQADKVSCWRTQRSTEFGVAIEVNHLGSPALALNPQSSPAKNIGLKVWSSMCSLRLAFFLLPVSLCLCFVYFFILPHTVCLLPFPAVYNFLTSLSLLSLSADCTSLLIST